MKRFVVLALALWSASGCVASGDSLEGSQSHFICVARADCEELGDNYGCQSGFCRLDTEESDASTAVPADGETDAAMLAPNALTYVGRWHIERDLDSDAYDEFLVLAESAGSACVTDGKSAMTFELSPAPDGVQMDMNEVGGHAVLRTSPDAGRLERTFVEKGVTYVTHYVRFEGTLPGWCNDQLAFVATD